MIFLSEMKLSNKIQTQNPEKGPVPTAEFTYQTCNDRVCLAPETLEFEKTSSAVA